MCSRYPITGENVRVPVFVRAARSGAGPGVDITPDYPQLSIWTTTRRFRRSLTRWNNRGRESARIPGSRYSASQVAELKTALEELAELHGVNGYACTFIPPDDWLARLAGLSETE